MNTREEERTAVREKGGLRTVGGGELGDGSVALAQQDRELGVRSLDRRVVLCPKVAEHNQRKKEGGRREEGIRLGRA